MKHALFVAFYYPPDATSSGVLRTLKYTQYLAEHGWRITVLSPHSSAYDSVDEASTAEIPPTVKVVRTPFVNTRRHLSLRGRYLALTALPDAHIGWLPWAVAAGMRVARSDPFDLVYSTSPPATAHLIAWRVARRLRKPWVIDFRDPWFEDIAEEGAPAGPLFRAIDRRLEAGVVAAASHVVSTTDNVRGMLVERYRSLPSDRFSVIANGYDERDFAHLPTASNSQTDHFTMVHAGSINPHFRDPIPLLAALRRAADAGDVDAGRIKLRFLGGGPHAESSALQQAISHYRLEACVEIVKRLPYAEGLRELAAADVLVLLQASEDTRALVPAKLYEYLRLGRPVLALTLAGEVSALLSRTAGGFAVDPVDVEQLASVLAALYRDWSSGTLGAHRPDMDALKRYERRALTGQLAAIFARLTSTDRYAAGHLTAK